MHSSSETLFFENLTRSQAQKNQKKSRIGVSILMTFPRRNTLFSWKIKKNQKIWGGFHFFTGPEKGPKSGLLGPPKTMIFNETSLKNCTFSKFAVLKN